MKKILLTATASLAVVAASNASLIITGVFDGPLTGGNPKGVELYVTADIPDLSIYGVGSANNGGGTDGQEYALSGTATTGSYIYVASEVTGFTDFFGFAPTFNGGTAVSINGDDAIELFKNGSVIDTFGEIDVDGTGTAWDSLDGWAYRKNWTPAGAFVVTNWLYSGINQLEGGVTNDTTTSPVPIGTFVPEPSVALLGGLGLLGLIRRRR